MDSDDVAMGAAGLASILRCLKTRLPTAKSEKESLRAGIGNSCFRTRIIGGKYCRNCFSDELVLRASNTIKS